MIKQTCSNCKHYHEHNDHTHWGECSKLRVNAQTTILTNEKPSSYSQKACVYSWFGCNEWCTKTKEI